jgi:peroxiredoxin
MIAAAGLKVVAIGLGEPKHARRYCGKLAPSINCYANEKPDLNFVYGLQRASLRELALSPSALKAGRRAYTAGFRQGQSTGDTMMKPGTFIVDTEGIIRYTYYSKNAGDHPLIADIVQLIR